MRKAIRTLFVLLACLLVHSGFSQNALRIQLADTSTIPPSADTATTFSFYVWVINDSAFEYTGQIGFGYKIDTTVYTTSNTTSGFGYTTSTDTIPPFDTIAKSITGYVRLPAFKTGPSVVVIWPIANGAVATDSLTFNILIGRPQGIEETDTERLQLWVMNSLLHIKRDAEIQLKQVRIYDLLGKEILNRQNPADNIPLPQTAKGIYLAEVIYNDNQRKLFRFYR
ncbi:MAG: T9SS type A sorting domain-containing protein [Bacteroidota bacterium]